MSELPPSRCTETSFKALLRKASIGVHITLCVHVILLHFLTLDNGKCDSMIVREISAHTTPQPLSKFVASKNDNNKTLKVALGLVYSHQNSTYVSGKFSYVGSYVNLVLSALVFAILYLGGWEFPIPLNNLANWLGVSETTPWLQVITASLGITMTVLKAYFLVFIAVLLRWTVPRVRIDQLLNLGWKFLLPVSLVNLLVTAALKLAFPVAFGG